MENKKKITLNQYAGSVPADKSLLAMSEKDKLAISEIKRLTKAQAALPAVEHAALLAMIKEINAELEAMSQYNQLNQVYQDYSDAVSRILSRSLLDVLKEKYLKPKNKMGKAV